MAAEIPAYDEVTRDGASSSRLGSRSGLSIASAPRCRAWLALAWLPLLMGCHYRGVISPRALDSIACGETPALDREELIERSRRARHAARSAERDGCPD